MPENDDLLPEFIAESVDLIEKARQDIDAILAGGSRGDSLNSIFRAVHTIKGGAGIFGLEKTKTIAHKLENLLDSMRAAPELVSATELAKEGKVIDHIEVLIQNQDKAPALRAEPEAPRPGATDFTALSTELSSVAAEPGPDAPSAEPKPAAPAAPATPTAPAAELLRIPMDRVQKNLDAISEIFLIRNQMTYLVERHFARSGADHDFVQAWESLDNELRRSIGELENVAMSMRMMPLTGLFSRLEKTVRAYVPESGKQIRVVKSGEDTELDKRVLDALGEPLIHLIRNAMDHGIESPETRRASGKPETGVITLGAKVAGNEVVITLSDDGMGMSGDRIKAAAKGLDVSKATDEKSAVELIFLPGFSTAAQVTETSGRGVGMDVVKSAVERLGGGIGIQTRPGEGSSFVIRLPLSMSVIPAILVRIHDQLYALGTGDIIETLRVPTRDLRLNSGETYLKYRGDYIPCVSLERVLPQPGPRETAYQGEIFVCIVRHEGTHLALQVGALERSTEIVVKPMPPLSPRMPYVAGISVLPTGQPVFVLSLSRLCREKIRLGGVLYETA